MKAIRILGFEPVNPAWDIGKVESLIENIKNNGWQGCPILTYGNILITGSHRQAALRQLFAEGENIDYDCAEDVTDIINQKLSGGGWQLKRFTKTLTPSELFLRAHGLRNSKTN